MTSPLRIAFFLYEFPVLSQTFVLNQITGLLDLGHDVTILAERRGSEAVEHPDVARYRLLERTCYLGMPQARMPRILGAPGRAGRAGGKPWRALDWRRYGNEARSLRLLYWTARLAGRGDFDIIHCHFGPPGRMAAFLREIGTLGGKLVTVFHGVDVSAYLRDDPHLYDHLFATGDLFLPISEVWRRRLVERGCNAARTQVHRMGVDLRLFPFRARERQPDRPLRVLTIGRMIEKKGIAYGLRAVGELRRQRLPVHYTLVGDGPLRAELEALAGELALGEAVSFLGWRDQDAVAALMQESDVLLAPSVTDANGDQEGIPVTLMEAMATGLPVVATWHSGIPELIEDGVSGFLAPERDVSALAGALARLLQHAEIGAGVGQAARERVAAEFDIRELNRRLVGHYRALLEEPMLPRRHASGIGVVSSESPRQSLA